MAQIYTWVHDSDYRNKERPANLSRFVLSLCDKIVRCMGLELGLMTFLKQIVI